MQLQVAQLQVAQPQGVQLAQLVRWLMRYLQLSLAQLQLEPSDQLQQQSL
jgi:hypothetical protein